MSKRSTDILFQLIRSLEKAEKRHFKLYIRRSSSNENLKVIQLFDALDKLTEYDEKMILKKIPAIQKAQLSNLKSHLYKQLLASLRLLKSADSIDLQLNEQFDYAHILYKKGLFFQSLKLLEKAKETAKIHQKFTFLTQVIALEKRIESLHITRSIQNRAEILSAEAIQVSSHIDMVARLSNLALQLYSWYIKNGHAKNEADEDRIKIFIEENLPAQAREQTGFYERLYLYQSFSWYAFIRQDFIQYYRYTQKWVDLFHDQPLMKRVETGHYIKGLHNLLNAHFDLRNHLKFAQTITIFENFSETERVRMNDNFRIHSYLYLSQAKINQHFLNGNFSEGASLIPGIESKLNEYALFIDSHRVLVLTYKIASLYFGNGNYDACILQLQKIINDNIGLRYDLQCYARLMHLLAHYELGNHELMEYLSKSVYRFMSKMQNLTKIEEEMIRFLRRSYYIPRSKMKLEMEKFLERVQPLEKHRYQARVFVYLDIISWVKSKVFNRNMSDIIKEKYRNDVRTALKSHKTVTLIPQKTLSS